MFVCTTDKHKKKIIYLNTFSQKKTRGAPVIPAVKEILSIQWGKLVNLLWKKKEKKKKKKQEKEEKKDISFLLILIN